MKLLAYSGLRFFRPPKAGGKTALKIYTKIVYVKRETSGAAARARLAPALCALL